MSTSIWYPRYVGDYGRKTSHLSLVEHGAYTLLLDHYYATGRPIPFDANAGASAVQVHRICRAFAAEEQAAVASVLAQFFHLEADGYHNDKADRELLKRGKISENRRFAARSRHASADASADASAVQVHTQLQPHLHLDSKNTPHPPVGGDDDFEKFWAAYPSRGKSANPRKPALAAWKKAIARGAKPADMIAAASKAAPDGKEGTEFVPMASTWLNQDRWLDVSRETIAGGADPELARWRARFEGWQSSKRWMPDLWGPPPGSDGCRVPAGVML